MSGTFHVHPLTLAGDGPSQFKLPHDHERGDQPHTHDVTDDGGTVTATHWVPDQLYRLTTTVIYRVPAGAQHPEAWVLDGVDELLRESQRNGFALDWTHEPSPSAPGEQDSGRFAVPIAGDPDTYREGDAWARAERQGDVT